MDTSMYYTFSTISQVLAAFLALSGVFLIFKIQELRKMHIARAQAFLDHYDSIFPNKQFYIEDIITTLKGPIMMENTVIADHVMERTIEIQKANLPETEVFLERIFDSTKPIAYTRKKLIILSLISMVIGILTILYSIIILAMVPKVVYLHDILSKIGIWGTTISIGFMMMTIIISLKEIDLTKK